MEKANLYVEQGLVRNAKRILENLRIRFPEDKRLNQKIEELKTISAKPGTKEKIDPKDIAEGVEKVTAKKVEEEPAVGKIEEEKVVIPGPRPVVEKTPSPVDISSEDMFTSADIFGETEIIPVVGQ